MKDTPGKLICLAVEMGQPDRLETLLKAPGLTAIDVYGEGALSEAVRRGSTECVRLLLAHPLIDVNWPNRFRLTPLHHAAYLGSREQPRIMMMLCRHRGINLNAFDEDLATPLWLACHRDSVNGVRCLLAHAPVGHLDMKTCAKKWCGENGGDDLHPQFWEGKTALEAANNPAIQEILSLYLADPRSGRSHLRLELGLTREDIARDFACVVLHCDGHLMLRSSAVAEPGARFFSIASKLPLELQMVLCHRRHDSGGAIVLARDTEQALKDLAADLSSFAPQ